MPTIDTYITTSEKLTRLNAERRDRSGWLHLSVDRRTQLLLELVREPKRYHQFQCRTRIFAYLAMTAMSLSLVVLLVFRR